MFRTSKFFAAGAIAVAGLVSYAAPGAGAPNARERASGYPLKVIAVQTSPSRPKAGHDFLAGMAIVNEETSLPLESGTVRCAAKIGRRPVRADFKLLDIGIATCAWTIPPRTGGMRFVARIRVLSDEGTVSVPFSKVIRR